MNKSSGLLAAGIVVLLAGLLAAAGLWYSAGEREADAVRNLARAPVGCDTTLDFERAGDFLVFIETVGQFRDEIEGDCDAGLGYIWTESSLPPVTLSLTAPDRTEIALDSASGVQYDSGGAVGQSVRAFTIDSPGDYTLRVDAPDDQTGFAIAVGRDPADGVQSLRLGAIAAALVGAVAGLLLIAISRRPTASPTPVSSDPWSTTPPQPTSPPGMPAPPPAPMGWQQPGPPTGPPNVAVPSDPSSWAGAPSVAGQPLVPNQTPPAPGPPTPGASPWSAEAQEPAQGTQSGASGDGERSPWAPPDAPSQ